LSRAFRTSFGSTRPFTHLEIGVIGFSDGAQGAQWNCWYNARSERAFCGVNLEGIQGSGWPLSAFIQRELARPMIFCMVDELREPDAIELRVWRDVWIAGVKHRSLGDELAPTPVQASRLTGAGWRRALRAAWDCTDKSARGRGFGEQDIVLRVSKRPKRAAKTSPHLQFKMLLWEEEPRSDVARRDAFVRARRSLLPAYKFVRSRSEPETGYPPVSFSAAN